MTFKDLQVGDKFKFGSSQAVVYIKTNDICEQHKDAGSARYDVAYATKEWPVWDDEEIIKVI